MANIPAKADNLVEGTTYGLLYLSKKFNKNAGLFLLTSTMVGPLTLTTSNPLSAYELILLITDLVKSASAAKTSA